MIDFFGSSFRLDHLQFIIGNILVVAVVINQHISLFEILLNPCSASGLSWGTDDCTLKEAFSQYGEVVEGEFKLAQMSF